MYICTLRKCMPTNCFMKHINRGLIPVIHTHFRLTIPMKCSKQRLCEEILQSLWRLELSQKVSLIRGGSRWNVPTRGALNNFSIRWKFLNFEQFQKLRSSWKIAVFCKTLNVWMPSSSSRIYWHKRELRRFKSKCLERLTVLDNVFLLNWIATGICGNNLSVCRKTTHIHKQKKTSGQQKAELKGICDCWL